MAPKTPTARGFTLAEKRSLLFEQVSLYMVFLVALIAATISFVALAAVGRQAGLGPASWLLPLAIDGFGIACSVGIVRSVASGEGWRDRTSEWVGLVSALALSVLGNVHHSLYVGSALLPDYVKVAYAAAIPMIVAYGIHVYGRAMARGISAHVLADDPDTIRFDVTQLGEQGQTVARAHAPAKITPRATRPAPTAPTAPQATAPDTRPTPAPQTAPRAPQAGTDKARMRDAFDQAVAADPFTKPNAKALQDALGIEAHPATPRGWVLDWWREHEAAMGTARPEPTVEDTATPGEKESGEEPEKGAA